MVPRRPVPLHDEEVDQTGFFFLPLLLRRLNCPLITVYLTWTENQPPWVGPAGVEINFLRVLSLCLWPVHSLEVTSKNVAGMRCVGKVWTNKWAASQSSCFPAEAKRSEQLSAWAARGLSPVERMRSRK